MKSIKRLLSRENYTGDTNRVVSFDRSDIVEVCRGLEAIVELGQDVSVLQDTVGILDASPPTGASDTTLDLAENLVKSAVESYGVDAKQFFKGRGPEGTCVSIEGIGDFIGGVFKSMNEGMRDLKDRAIMASETSIHDAASVAARAQGVAKRATSLHSQRSGKYDRRVFIAHFVDKTRNPVVTAERLRETMHSFGQASKVMLDIAVAARSVFEIKPSPVDFDHLIESLPSDNARGKHVSLTGNAGFYGTEYSLTGVQGHARNREELITALRDTSVLVTSFWSNSQLQCKSLDGMEPEELQAVAVALNEGMLHVVSTLTAAKAVYSVILRYLDYNKNFDNFNNELEDYIANTEELVDSENKAVGARIETMSKTDAPHQDEHVHPEAYKAFFTKQLGILEAMVSTQLKVSIANIQAGAALVDYLEWCTAPR